MHMGIRFSKWHGTGNDFILIDDRSGSFPSGEIALVRRMCDRHFGIGSDGLILVQAPRTIGSDFHMEFFNPDGSKSFCGNGSRCAFAFWRTLVGKDRASFSAIDGDHQAAMEPEGVRVSLAPPRSVERIDAATDFIHTGSPHLLIWVDHPDAVDIVPEARVHRYGARFGKEGVNVNFLRWKDGRVEMRTYERGVEAETLSCGTGVTAAALDALHRGLAHGNAVPVHTRGGELRVDVVQENGRVASVDLIGPATPIFDGTYAG